MIVLDMNNGCIVICDNQSDKEQDKPRYSEGPELGLQVVTSQPNQQDEDELPIILSILEVG